MDHSETVRAFLGFLASGDIDSLTPLLSDDFTAAGPTLELGKQQALAYLRMFHTAFPDTAYNFGEIESEAGGNIVRVSAQQTGTHTGMLDLNAFGIPLALSPTGKTFSLPVSTFEFAVGGGKITHMREHTPANGGLRGALVQLGVTL